MGGPKSLEAPAKLNTNVYSSRRCLHTRLFTDDWVALKTKLFEHGLTAQDLFQGYAELLLNDYGPAKTVLERIIRDIVQKKMDAAEEGRDWRRPPKQTGATNPELLYSLIEAKDDDARGDGEAD